MRLLTLDASVLLKWFLQTPDERDLPQAATILVGLRQGNLALVQPPHTLLEVAAVLVRARPDTIASDLAEIGAVLDDATIETGRVLSRALQLSAALGHPLFDTLYHAAALETGATLITADRRYHNKAAPLGQITLLEQFAP
jgi:predicted nucleic acid-binding protein